MSQAGALLEVIDAKIAKFQRLREIASDPELLETLQSGLLLGSRRAQTPHVEKRVLPIYGKLIVGVYEVMKDCSEPVDVAEVQRKMVEAGFSFQTTQSPRVAISSALQKLTRRGMIQLVQRGQGRIGNQYVGVKEKRPAAFVKTSADR